MKNKNLQKKRKLLIKIAKLDTTFIKSPGLVKYVKKIIKLVESRNNLSIQISNLNYASDDYDHIFVNIIILNGSDEECFGMWVKSCNIDNRGNHKFKHNCIIKRFCEWKLNPQ